MEFYEQPLSTRRIFEGKILNLREDTVRLPDGASSVREVVEHSGGVCVVAVDEAGRLLFVQQYRYPQGRVMTELPAGKVNPGEQHYDCGLRELEEETGYTAKTYRHLATVVPSPAYLTEVIQVYYAADLAPVGQRLDEGEFLQVLRLTPEEALEKILADEIQDSKTQIGVLRYLALRQKGLL